VGVKNLIETLLRSEGSLERESKVENIFRPLIRDAWGRGQHTLLHTRTSNMTK
jgi:hypothetical protein